jgi:hypothetical protein
MNMPDAAAIKTIESGAAFATATSVDFTRAQIAVEGQARVLPNFLLSAPL